MPESAQQKIRNLFNSSVGDAILVYEFNLFDTSVSQKLWSTNHYYYDELVTLDILKYIVAPLSSTQSSSGSQADESPPIDIPGYCRNLNRILDGFFMNCMSVLDTLAHELLILYNLQQRPRDIYIKTIKEILVQEQPNSETGKLLASQLGQLWFGEFEPYRHCTTHECLINYEINVPFDQLTKRYRPPKIKLPDDPKVRPFTYRKNRVANQYCKIILKRVDSLVSKTYESIWKDIRKCHDILPIQVP